MTATKKADSGRQLATRVAAQLGVAPQALPEETEWFSSGNTIGALCLRVGTMDFAQVEQTLAAQGASGELFGSVAIRLGFLTRRGLDIVLDLQRIHRALDLGTMLALTGCVELPEFLERISENLAGDEREPLQAPSLEPACESAVKQHDQEALCEASPFGLYLVSRGRISRPQLVIALARQRAERVSIGRSAYEQGVMTLDQVVEVLGLQKANNRPYGEIAVELGYLSAEQLGDLLAQQLEAAIPLGQLLVQMGALDPEALRAEKAAYDARLGASED